MRDAAGEPTREELPDIRRDRRAAGLRHEHRREGADLARVRDRRRDAGRARERLQRVQLVEDDRRPLRARRRVRGLPRRVGRPSLRAAWLTLVDLATGTRFSAATSPRSPRASATSTTRRRARRLRVDPSTYRGRGTGRWKVQLRRGGRVRTLRESRTALTGL